MNRGSVWTWAFQPPPECRRCDGLGLILNIRTAPRKCRACGGTGLAKAKVPA